MKQYQKPEFHFVRNTGGLSGNEIAKLSEAELNQYLNCDNCKEEKKMYRISSGYILREIAGEYAIVPLDSDSVFSNAVMAPNDSAVFLWKSFEDSSTIEDIVKKGVQEYDVTEDEIRKSIERFIEESLKYGILEAVE